MAELKRDTFKIDTAVTDSLIENHPDKMTSEIRVDDGAITVYVFEFESEDVIFRYEDPNSIESEYIQNPKASLIGNAIEPAIAQMSRKDTEIGQIAYDGSEYFAGDLDRLEEAYDLDIEKEIR